MSAGWNTIESDAGGTNISSQLLKPLKPLIGSIIGAKDVQCEELLTLDSEHLRQLSPIYGVIFLFKYPKGERAGSVPNDGDFDPAAAETHFFAAQTIQNACGTQALLSVLLNKEAELEIGPQLKDFKEFTSAFPPELRGEALSNSESIRDVHNSFARSSPFVSDEQRFATDEEDVYHFIAYTSLAGKLFELDGLQAAPISHGPCTQDEFSDKVIPVLQRRIERYPANEIRFNLLAMIRDPRTRAHEIGDKVLLEQEKRKRAAWQWENALRQHNFVGLIGEMLKTTTTAKLREGEGKYDAWISDSKAQTMARIQEHRKKPSHEMADG